MLFRQSGSMRVVQLMKSDNTAAALDSLKKARAALTKAMAHLYEARSRCSPSSPVWVHVPMGQSLIHKVEIAIQKAEEFLLKKDKE